MQSKPEEMKRTGSMELLARQLVEGFITGLHKSPYHGFSVEFAEHRLYNEGQSTRHIDWKVFARTDRLYTKQYEEETNLRCLVVLDCSPSMYYPVESLGKISFSVFAAAALAYLLHRQRDAIGLCLFGERIEELTAVKSTGTHLQKILTLLDTVTKRPQPKRPTRVSEVLHEVAEKVHKRSLVVIFSDMFDAGDADEVFKSLQHLKHNKHEVLLFHVSDHDTELSFKFEERPYEFIDLESGEKIRLNPEEIRVRYQEAQVAFHKALQHKCNQLKIDFVSVNTRTDYHDILQSYLIKRSKMR